MKKSTFRTLIHCTVMLSVCVFAPAVDAATDSRFSQFSLPPGLTTVVASFELNEITEIRDDAETFEFIGQLILTWKDPRNAFDPQIEGVTEKVFTGDFQFNEIAPGWYPQIVLVNESGEFRQSGVSQRIRPDGTSVLTTTVSAVAEAEFTMYHFPFDSHNLEAVFEVLDSSGREVVLEATPPATDLAAHSARIPEWTVTGISLSSRLRDRSESTTSARDPSSALVLTASVDRNSYYYGRLVILPLVMIVLLSFSVFWMNRASLGDRLNVSFIGILTAVAYQLMISEQIPRTADVTLMHGFLSFSFLTMCATVVVSLAISVMDSRGRQRFGDVVDRHCRWAFPLGYFSILGIQLAVAFIFF